MIAKPLNTFVRRAFDTRLLRRHAAASRHKFGLSHNDHPSCPLRFIRAGSWMVFFPFQEAIVQRLRIAFLVSAVAIVAIELVGPAAAQTVAHRAADTHVLVVRLPDGSLERIRYAGDRPPQIRFDSQPDSGFFDPFWPSAPFADLDRISAAMDREAAAMMQQADNMMQASPGNPTDIGLNGLPAGMQGYSMVSTMSGNGVCTRSVRYFSSSDGKPHVESSTSGNCSAGRAAGAPLPAKAPRPALKSKTSRVIEVDARPPATEGGMSQARLRLASAVN